MSWSALIISFFTIMLTFGTNIIFNWIKIKYDWFTDTKKFKRERDAKQLNELYYELYGIVAQSEYLRHFFSEGVEGVDGNSLTNKNEMPFIELVPSANSDEIAKMIGYFNKSRIAELIIQKSSYASPDLIKLAVGYRFCEAYYQKQGGNIKNLQEKLNNEELLIISKIVKNIVKETNSKMKNCGFNYYEDELKDGNMNNYIYKK
ncbi:hypothetical protein ABEX00_10885 [Bacillus safensis]|uniref:hypothetical protein n=1 Tax=Bacillus safensis TaxID=561879 RepID=UPI002E1A40C8|nr:hypothetical protein [Bacillus safensis]